MCAGIPALFTPCVSCMFFRNTSQRDDVLDQRKSRKETIEKLLLDVKQRMNDHNSGARLLSEEELIEHQNKMKILNKRIKKLSMIPAEKEIEHILERERKKKEAYEEKLRRKEEL